MDDYAKIESLATDYGSTFLAVWTTLDRDGLTLAERERGPDHLIEVFTVDEDCPGFSSLVQMVMFKGAYHLEDQRYADPIQRDELGMDYQALVQSGRCTIIGRWTEETKTVNVLDSAHENWLLL